METPSHSGHETYSAITPDHSILKPLRALVVALLCMSGGCATISSVSQNSVTQPCAGAQTNVKRSGAVSKPASQPTNDTSKIQDKPQEDNKQDKPTYDPERQKKRPCDRIKLDKEGACIMV